MLRRLLPRIARWHKGQSAFSSSWLADQADDNNIKDVEVTNWSLKVKLAEDKEEEFPLVYLRDNCPKCFHPSTKDRMLLLRHAPMDIRAEKVDICPESGQVRSLLLN